MSGKFYDISAKITNELPTVKITDDIIVTVNNRKSTILNVAAMAMEASKKPDYSENDDIEIMQKAMRMFIGEKASAQIEDMDLPVDEYTKIYKTILSVAKGMGTDGDETP